MKPNIDYILDHIGGEATEETVRAEFSGLSLYEITAKLDELFPTEKNHALAEAIFDLVS